MCNNILVLLFGNSLCSALTSSTYILIVIVVEGPPYAIVFGINNEIGKK